MARGKHVLSRQLWIIGTFVFFLESAYILCSLCVTWCAGLFPRVWFTAQWYLLLFLTQPKMMLISNCIFLRISLSMYAAKCNFHEHFVMTWISSVQSVHHRHRCAREKKNLSELSRGMRRSRCVTGKN